MVALAQSEVAAEEAEAEAEAVNRLLYLAQAAGEAPVYVVHLSTKKGLEEIRKAKAAGRKHMGAETCPQYLLLDEKLYDDPQEGLKAIMAPPLRRQEDRDALWAALKENELDTVATDHCPFTFAKQKQQGAEDFTKCPGRGGETNAALFRRCEEGTDHPAATGEVRVYESGTGGRAVPAQRHDRGRRGRGPGDPEPGEGMDADGAEDAQRCGLYVL